MNKQSCIYGVDKTLQFSEQKRDRQRRNDRWVRDWPCGSWANGSNIANLVRENSPLEGCSATGPLIQRIHTMNFYNVTIPSQIRSLKGRGARFCRLICIVLLAGAVASPSITRFWQRRDIARLANQYQSLVEQGCYREARWVANLASESYPDSSVAKYMAAHSERLLRLSYWNFEDESDPFSAVARDFSDQET
jgi:hypothetical protein